MSVQPTVGCAGITRCGASTCGLLSLHYTAPTLTPKFKASKLVWKINDYTGYVCIQTTCMDPLMSTYWLVMFLTSPFWGGVWHFLSPARKGVATQEDGKNAYFVHNCLGKIIVDSIKKNVLEKSHPANLVPLFLLRNVPSWIHPKQGFFWVCVCVKGCIWACVSFFFLHFLWACCSWIRNCPFRF